MKERSRREVVFGNPYRCVCSMRFVFLDPEFGAGEDDSLAVEFLLWQEIAHQRFWNCGNSHIFVQCFIPVSYTQWQ
jgi:hypothetical protein